MHENARPLRWRLGILAAIAITLVALYPQFVLVITRGRDWNGSYAFFSQDEISYSAYVKALAEGRPRRNDPYTGRDDAPGSVQPESIFSIQFVPAYLIALPARFFGLSPSAMFIFLTGIIVFASALAVFWLIRLVTGDDWFAATGALVVLCLGTFAVIYAPLRIVLGWDTTFTFEYFPFARRYVPAVPFPLLFLFCALVWRALINQNERSAWRAAGTASVAYAVLIFSYFYLWTAAAAWVTCLGVLWILARPEGYKKGLTRLGVIGLAAVGALVPYFVLVSNRASTMDAVQLLAASHSPDLSRSSIKLGLIVCVFLGYAVWRGYLKWRDSAVLLTISLALTPLVVFNQQVITGRSLQPLHYELYVAKYLALLAMVLAIALFWLARKGPLRLIPKVVLVGVSVVALGWGMVETTVETKRHIWASVDRDEVVPVAKRLAELAPRDAERGDTSETVLYVNLEHADFSPVIAPQPVLWSPHVPAFSGVTLDENRERLYQYLYYTGEALEGIDEAKFESLDHRRKYLIHSMIEWGHNDPAWTVDWKSITAEDVREALRGYANYASAFTREQAARPTLTYVVTSTENPPDFANLDRWYERAAGERLGKFTLYRVRLRPIEVKPDLEQR